MALKPRIINHTIGTINTEEPITLPENVHDMHMRLRDATHSMKIAVVSGDSGTTYISLDSTLPALNLEDIGLFRGTLYVQSPDLATLELIVLVQ